MILDEEVFAVVMAIVIIGSILGAVIYIRPMGSGESFVALSILNERCKMGEYPRQIIENSNITLCLSIYNHMGKPIYYKVVYKIGTNTTLPTNTTASPEKPILSWRGVVYDDANNTFLINVPVYVPGNYSPDRIALIFELWIYDTSRDEWVYTGIWNHLYVKVIRG